MFVQCELKIPSLGITVQHHVTSLVMPNSYSCDGIFNPNLTTIKDFYILWLWFCFSLYPSLTSLDRFFRWRSSWRLSLQDILKLTSLKVELDTRRYRHCKNTKTLDTWNIAVNFLKFEQCGSIYLCIQKMCRLRSNCSGSTLFTQTCLSKYLT